MLRKRARSPQAKAERRLALLNAARTLLLECGSIQQLRIDQVARLAGLAKGSVYGYFSSKEALLLALYDETFHAWVDLLPELPRAEEALRPAVVVHALLASVGAAPHLPMLLRALFSTLEPNVGYEALVASKRSTLVQLRRMSRWLGAGLDLSEDEAFLLVRHLLVVIVGMAQISGPRPEVRAVLEEPDLAPLRLPARPMLADTLLFVIHGWLVQRERRERPAR